jgi:hypothetical protein
MICTIILGYVGSQADKFKDAAQVNELLTTMPELQNNLASKNSSKKILKQKELHKTTSF